MDRRLAASLDHYLTTPPADYLASDECPRCGGTIKAIDRWYGTIWACVDPECDHRIDPASAGDGPEEWEDGR